MNTKIPPIIIIKKAAHGRHPPHGGAWKVAYADFVTAMMAFFLVMWIVNTSPQVRTGVASYFRDPGFFETSSGGGAMPGASAGALPGNAPAPDVAVARAALEAAAERIRQGLQGTAGFASIEHRVEMTLGADGLRIELLDLGDSGFFGVGSADVHPDAVTVLRVIAEQVSALPSMIAIEGHTDARLYERTGYGNWDLSAARANAARRVLESGGVSASQVEALHGYADARLRHPDDPLDPRNRRVAIVLRHAP
jgi:chemotaxis protein MotB